MPTPLAHTYDEKLDLEIGWRLPLTKYLENPLLGILILYGRTLRALEPADHIFHVLLLFCKFVAHKKRHRRDLAQFTRLRVAQIPCYGVSRNNPAFGCGHIHRRSALERSLPKSCGPR